MGTFISSGQNFEVRNIALNSTTDTPIDFNQRVNSVVFHCRTAVDVQFRKTSGDADYVTIPSGSSFTLDVSSTDNGQGGFVVGYARSASATPVLEVIGAF